MREHFDLIPIPRGQAPGGPVQASDGTWYLVLPAFADLDQILHQIEEMRKARPISEEEKRRAAQSLCARHQSSEKAK